MKKMVQDRINGFIFSCCTILHKKKQCKYSVRWDFPVIFKILHIFWHFPGTLFKIWINDCMGYVANHCMTLEVQKKKHYYKQYEVIEHKIPFLVNFGSFFMDIFYWTTQYKKKVYHWYAEVRTSPLIPLSLRNEKFFFLPTKQRISKLCSSHRIATSADESEEVEWEEEWKEMVVEGER